MKKDAAMSQSLAAGLSLGIIWGVPMFVCTLVASQNGFATNMLESFVGMYPYYELTVAGAFWGLLWAFLDGFIGGYILLWLYNSILKKLA